MREAENEEKNIVIIHVKTFLCAVSRHPAYCGGGDDQGVNQEYKCNHRIIFHSQKLGMFLILLMVLALSENCVRFY